MDLNAPLGMTPPPRRRRTAPIIGAVVAALALGGFGLYLVEADPRGGEPYAVAVIPPPKVPAPQAAPSVDRTPTGSIGSPKPPAALPDEVRIENGVRVVSPAVPGRGAGQRDPGPYIIDVTKALDNDGRRQPPKNGGNAAVPPDAHPAPRPRVAIFVGGMGLDAPATRTAIETMPAAVSLAFVPYGVSIDASVDAAKAKGHEILLQLPMQSATGAAPGSHILRVDETPDEMTRDLVWLMGRFDGYVGVTNLLGAPVTGNQAAMTIILRSIGQRHLFYLDDGTSRHSVGRSVGADLGVPAVQADVVIDATADPAVVQANLDRLAAIARMKGSAIGMASGFPDHLPAIARFAADLDAQGLSLVPVSAIANSGDRLATTR